MNPLPPAPADVWPNSPEDAQRSRDTLDRLLQGFQLVGFDWRYLYVNPAAARHGRRTPRELVGRTIAEAYPGIEATPAFATLQRCMRERASAVFEYQFIYDDGTTRWFEVRVQPVPEGICIFSVDIDDRKSAEAARAPSDAGPHRGARSLFARLRRVFTR